MKQNAQLPPKDENLAKQVNPSTLERIQAARRLIATGCPMRSALQQQGISSPESFRVLDEHRLQSVAVDREVAAVMLEAVVRLSGDVEMLMQTVAHVQRQVAQPDVVTITEEPRQKKATDRE